MALTQIPSSMLANAGAELGMRNRIINGAMQIDQRNAGALFTVPNANGYGSCDRWASLAGATSTWTMQRVASGLASFPYALQVGRVAASSSATAIYIGQIIETVNCQDLAGSSVTLSFYAKAGANYSGVSNLLTVEIWTGSGSDQGWQSLNTAAWTSQAQTLVSTATLTTSYQRFTFNVNIPAGTNEIGLRFYYVGTGTAGANDWYQITGVQLEAGSVATPFERRPYGMELALCQRYFETGNQPYFYIGFGATGYTAAYGDVRFAVTKRAGGATITATAWQYFSGGSATAFTPAFGSAAIDRLNFQGTSLTNWNGWTGNGTWTASAEL